MCTVRRQPYVRATGTHCKLTRSDHTPLVLCDWLAEILSIFVEK